MEQQTITNIVVTDSQWTPVPNINVLESNVSDVYFTIQGTYFRPSTIVYVDTNLTDVTYVSADRLHIKAPSLDDGQYTVTVVRPDGQTSTRSIMYSGKPVWSGVSDLGYVYGPFRFQLSANSDSNVNYTSTDIPAGTILYGNGLYEGNILSNTASVYGFTVSAVDEENQVTSRDLSVTYSIPEWKYTDDVWNPSTQTALDSNTSTVYWTIEGVDATGVTGILVDGTPVTSFSVVSDSILGVQGPEKPRGTYDVSIVTPSTTTVFPDRVFFSDVPSWVNDLDTVAILNETKITPPSYVSSCSMTSDGSRMIIGNHKDTGDTGGIEVGAAYVYVRTGSSSWVQEARLENQLFYDASFGYSCSISGDGSRVIVGSSAEDANGLLFVGVVYVFVRSGLSWGQEALLVPSNGKQGMRFGYSCSMNEDGSRFIVGANFGGTNYAGSAYVFVRSGTSWIEEAILGASVPESSYFGECCAMNSDGSRVIVGAIEETVNGLTLAGAAYVFVRSGSSWTQQARLVASDVKQYVRFGRSCSMSADGSRVAVGSNESLADEGAVYVFTASGSSWSQEAKLLALDPKDDAFFGVSISGNADWSRLLIGARGYDGTQTDGAIYVFERSASSWAQSAKTSASYVLPLSSYMSYTMSCSLSGDGSRFIIGGAAGGLYDYECKDAELLGNVSEGVAFSIPVEATSDSNVLYSNTNALPPNTTLSTSTGQLAGTITSTEDTTFGIVVRATDEENQSVSRLFTLNYTYIAYVTSGLLLSLDMSSTSYPGSGTTWYDLSGNNYNGTLTNGVTYATGAEGPYLNLSGTQYINGVHNATLDRTGDMTAEVWFQVSTNPAGDCVRFFGKGDSTNRTFGLWQCSGSLFLYQRYGANGSINAQYNATVNTGQWYHMVGVSSGANHVLYLNNVQVATSTGASSFYSSADPYKIGYGAPHTYHQGRIGLVRMYNRGLSAAEVTQNWNDSRGKYGL